MSAILYYLFVFPISLLPLRIIYVFTDFLHVLLLFVFPYREKVILNNLRNSFPNKSKQEIQLLKRNFYKHFCDILAEGIKNLSISKKELSKRMKVKNPEILEELYRKNKNVLLVSGHYNNWEWLITYQNLLFSHQAVGIGMPLSSKFWDKKLNDRRSRFGMKVIHSKIVNEYFSQNHEKPFATLVLADQSPGDSNKAYWMNFLNQETAVLFGCEMLAHTYNHVVVFFVVNKIKRGYYEIELQLITDNPKNCSWGEITENHTKLLEQEILKNPASWLWSHKRWKRTIPENLAQLKVEQKSKFDEKFK
jgi:Kdo2-lipid IVA lauroyltransferase/acyltransferase